MNLEVLTLAKLDYLYVIPKAITCLPVLEHLLVTNCPNLLYGLANLVSPARVKSLNLFW